MQRWLRRDPSRLVHVPPVTVIAAAVVLLLAVALASTATAGTGLPPASVSTLSVGASLVVGVAGGLIGTMGLLILAALLNRRRNRSLGTHVLRAPVPRSSAVILFISLGLLFTIGIIVIWFRGSGHSRLSQLGGGGGGASARSFGSFAADPAFLNLALATGAVVLIATSAFMLLPLWRDRRAAAAEPAAAAAGDRLARTRRQAAETALVALQDERDPRRAVIAGYLTLERLLAAAGATRRPSEAPLEYVLGVSVLSGVRRDAANRLTQLFELARFSHHAVGESIRQDAYTQLQTIRGSDSS